MVDSLALILVLGSGLYLIGLGALALSRPGLAARFLLGFATSARLHYLEMLMRLMIGLALLRRSPAMLWPDLFAGFGWLLIITTIALCAIPWRWHQRFAQQVVPRALQHLRLFALVSLVAGVALLWALSYPALHTNRPANALADLPLATRARGAPCLGQRGSPRQGFRPSYRCLEWVAHAAPRGCGRFPPLDSLPGAHHADPTSFAAADRC